MADECACMCTENLLDLIMSVKTLEGKVWEKEKYRIARSSQMEGGYIKHVLKRKEGHEERRCQIKGI